MGSNESKPSNYEKRQIEESTATTTTPYHKKTTQENNTDRHHDRRGIRFHRRGHSRDLNRNQTEIQSTPAPSSSATPPLPPSSGKTTISATSNIPRTHNDSPTSIINVSGRRPSLKKSRHSTNLLSMIKHPQASMRKSFSSGSESGDSTDTNKTSSSSGRMVPISAISNDDYPIDTGSAAMISAVATAMAASTPSMGSHTTSNGDGSTNAPQLMSTSNGTANNSNRIKGNKNSIQNNNNEQRPNMNAATLLHPSESGNISNEEKQKHQPECESQINNASERLLMELYLLPESDGRRRRERDRQQRQHYLLKYVWRANFKVPLQSPSLIVNWCCGTGIWAMEMAQQFPNCHVVGMDFQSATLSSLGRSIKNLSFQNVIMQRDKTGLESLEEGTVDYLMMRDVWLVNSPGHKWFETLAEVFRILKPGGWVEIYEQDMGVHSPGPYMHIADDLYGNMYKGVGIPRTISDELSFMMNKIGYIKIDERAIELPVGEWSSVPALKETGYLFKDLMVRRFRTFAPWLSEFSDISLDEVNHILDKCIVECEEYKTSMCWRYFAAQKPPQQEKKAGLSD